MLTFHGKGNFWPSPSLLEEYWTAVSGGVKCGVGRYYLQEHSLFNFGTWTQLKSAVGYDVCRCLVQTTLSVAGSRLMQIQQCNELLHQLERPVCHIFGMRSRRELEKKSPADFTGVEVFRKIVYEVSFAAACLDIGRLVSGFFLSRYLRDTVSHPGTYSFVKNVLLGCGVQVCAQLFMYACLQKLIPFSLQYKEDAADLTITVISEIWYCPLSVLVTFLQLNANELHACTFNQEEQELHNGSEVSKVQVICIICRDPNTKTRAIAQLNALAEKAKSAGCPEKRK